MPTLDIKLGYACNNNCFHCVVKPNKIIFHQQSKKDLTYGEITAFIDKYIGCSYAIYDGVVLTGGEPTLRNDLPRIVKYIKSIRRNVHISIQTNGRKLKQFIEACEKISCGEYLKNISFIVALHSMNESLHNKITANTCGGNSYHETIESIECLINKVGIGRVNKISRIEIVLSSLNKDDTADTVEKLYHEYGIKKFGISYPHLAGYTTEEIYDKGFDPELVKEITENISRMSEKYKGTLEICLESFPQCIFAESNGIAVLPLGITCIQRKHKDDAVIYHRDRMMEKTLVDTGKYYTQCLECANYMYCDGMWEEAVGYYTKPSYIKPIKLTACDI